jgi:Acetoacetate decarboxylase (ADC)
MPVRIRDAAACLAMFLVRAAAARSVVEYAGVDVVQPVPGRALCSLVFVQYRDGDLGRYHEFGVAFLIRSPVGRGAAAFVHWLPVDQSFTLHAGRSIWGFPKVMADIELRRDGRGQRCAVHHDGQLVVDLLVKPGMPMPTIGSVTFIDAYTCLDGVLRRIPWELRAHRMRVRPGGARLRLGEHPFAEELRRLGLPRRAVVSSGIGRAEMTFSDAAQVR